MPSSSGLWLGPPGEAPLGAPSLPPVSHPLPLSGRVLGAREPGGERDMALHGRESE